MAINISHFKERLLKERENVEKELSQVGRINPENTADWEPVAADIDTNTAEIEERASEITSFEDRSALEFEFEKQLENINGALARMESGKFGKCVTCNEEIDEARLEANPSATTCRAHMG